MGRAPRWLGCSSCPGCGAFSPARLAVRDLRITSPSDAAAARRELLRDAYADARRQALELAGVAGFSRVTSLELRLDAMDGFNPDELLLPTDRLGMGVSFCAT